MFNKNGRQRTFAEILAEILALLNYRFTHATPSTEPTWYGSNEHTFRFASKRTPSDSRPEMGLRFAHGHSATCTQDHLRGVPDPVCAAAANCDWRD